jgi:hypothetical protein
MEGPVAASLESTLAAFVRRRRRQPTLADWPALIRDANPEGVLEALVKDGDDEGVRLDDLGVVLYSRERLSEARLRVLGARPIEGTGLALARVRSGRLDLEDDRADPRRQAAREAAIAGMVNYLAVNDARVLESILSIRYGNRPKKLRFVDPLATFDPQTQNAVLSPIGLIQLYREYFFEFDTFLGPAVGHVWVSPGGMVELFEVHTRRSLEERHVEVALETIGRSETEIVEQDELSTAVAEQNARNTNVGISASSGMNFGVVQSSASVNTGLQFTHSTSEQTAHKHARQQSERLSTELRRNFRVSFRTSVEVEDTSSRRYVLQNTTHDLVNYELRRKMRQVGVQLQHIGTQLCWQVYVDEPGRDLGIAQLVHVAQPSDLDPSIQPPEGPAVLAAKATEVTVPFAYELLAGPDGPHATYIDGVAQIPPLFESRIRASRVYDAVPPSPGYTLKSVVEVSAVDPVDPEREPPQVSARYEVRGPTRIRIRLKQVTFNHQTALRFTLSLIWNPPDQTAAQEEYKQKLAEFTEAERRRAHAQYVRAVKERVKLASAIRKRASTDLREEERIVVFRHVIGQLTPVGDADTPHVTAELIRALFDVDALLYFVAPEWWRPRPRHHQQVGQAGAASPLVTEVSAAAAAAFGEGDTHTLTTDDTVSWGGADAQRPNNYLITEDAEPAPMGASLGWLIQLDGDEHRHAFLNSPWVKAVIPIRPSKEQAALRWLELAEVEGADGLDEPYVGTEPELQGKTVRQALLALAQQIAALNTDPQSVLATETVFETGFDPLAAGFRASGQPFEVFDQWIEVLPTDQVVALEYEGDHA